MLPYQPLVLCGWLQSELTNVSCRTYYGASWDLSPKADLRPSRG